MKLKRIHIIGGPGSGKSYLSRTLSKELQIPCHELDEIYWDKKANNYLKKTKEHIRDKKLNSIISKKRWIVEGSYKSWTMPSLKKADVVVILRPNILLRDLRLFKRFLKRKFRIEKGKKESLKNFIEMIEYNHKYEDTYAKIKKMAREAKTKSREFKNTDEALEFILRS